eukprot:s2741_g6.t1
MCHIVLKHAETIGGFMMAVQQSKSSPQPSVCRAMCARGMLRIFRLLTLDKYIPSVSLIGRVFAKHAKDFQMAAYASASPEPQLLAPRSRLHRLCLVRRLWLIFSALMWLTERHDRTEVDDVTMAQRYGTMFSAMPYTLVHLTGCVLFLALLFAVGVVSVPTGLLASGFTQELKKFRAEERQKRVDAATTIERAIISYLRRRRLRKITEETKADNPNKIKMVDFLEQKTLSGRVWKKVMLLLIILNVLAALGSDFLNGFELMSVLLFTFEYLANVWSANANIRYCFHRRNYTLSFFGVVDLVTVAPFWVQTVMYLSGMQFNAFIFRIARLLRILQLEDFVESFTLLDDAWRSCRETMVATGFMALLVWVCGAVLFYEFEQEQVVGIGFLGVHWASCMEFPSVPCLKLSVMFWLIKRKRKMNNHVKSSTFFQKCPDDPPQDDVCTELRHRAEQADLEARAARERKSRQAEQMRYLDDKRTHCEEASEGVELLRSSQQNLQAELKRLEVQAEPMLSQLSTLRKQLAKSEDSAKEHAARLASCKASLPQMVSELKAAQVEELSNLRTSQLEDKTMPTLSEKMRDSFIPLAILGRL